MVKSSEAALLFVDVDWRSNDDDDDEIGCWTSNSEFLWRGVVKAVVGEASVDSARGMEY